MKLREQGGALVPRPAPCPPPHAITWLEQPVHLADHLLQLARVVVAGLEAHDQVVGLGLQLAEGKGLQLMAEARHPEPVGEWRVDCEGLACLAPSAALRLDEAQCTHVVQPVGQLNKEHSDIGRHREDQLAQIL